MPNSDYIAIAVSILILVVFLAVGIWASTKDFNVYDDKDKNKKRK